MFVSRGVPGTPSSCRRPLLLSLGGVCLLNGGRGGWIIVCKWASYNVGG